MSFSLVGFLKGILISQENTLTPTQIAIEPGGTAGTLTTVQGSQTVNRTITLPDATDTLAGVSATQTLSNKTLNSTDVATGVTMASFTPDGTHTLTAPAVTDTLTANAATQTLTNKTITAGSNTITGLTDSNIATGADINANKIGAGTVSNTAYGYIANLTSDAQTQLNSKLTASGGTISNSTIDDTNTITVKDANFTIQDDGDTTKQLQFQVSGVTTGTTRTLTVPDATDTIAVLNATQTLTNKTLGSTNNASGIYMTNFTPDGVHILAGPPVTDTLVTLSANQTLSSKTLTNTTVETIKDSNLTIQNATDITKQAQFSASSISTGTTRTYTLPDTSDTLVTLAATQTLTNKTLTGNTAATLVNGTGTLTLPANTNDTLVGRATTDTLSNKTLQKLVGTVVTDSTTTGASQTLPSGDVNAVVIRLTNSGLSSLSGITAGSSGQQITVENLTGTTISIKDNDSGATAGNQIRTGTNSSVTMASNAVYSFTYDSTTGYWYLTGGTGSSSGGTGKNYLSAIVTSQSTTPNTGNGNFELGSTTGFSLFNTTLTGVIPTGTISSGASSVNSFAQTGSGTQIAGNYSLYFGSNAFTAGQGFISDPFYIDTEDQAKVLTTKFYYKVNSGATNGNFSGTSSNTIAVYIYDVTNSAWIQPAGVYGITQSSGVGILTATFQTTSNSTQYRVAVLAINSTSGPLTFVIDDISVGPQTAPIGAPVTSWQSYTLVPGGSTTAPTKGTVTYDNAQWRRVGDTMEIQYTYTQSTAGTAGSGTYLFPLPSGYTIDTTKVNLPTSTTALIYGGSTVGSGWVATTAASNSNYTTILDVAVWNSTNLAANAQTSTSPIQAFPLSSTSGNNFSVAGLQITFFARVPIAGWSSNVQMSNDTDTRVVAAVVSGTSTSIPGTSSNTVIIPTTVVNDTHGAFNATTGIYTVPVSGYYQVNMVLTLSMNSAGNSGAGILFYNGSSLIQLGRFYVASNAPQGNAGGSAIVYCKAGDTLGFYSNANTTNTPIAYYASINRLSGPSVIAATESINMRYLDTSGGSIGTSAGIYKFQTKDFDTHGAYSSSTGLYTVPVSGKYLIASTLTATATAYPAGGSLVIYVYHNGTFAGLLGQSILSTSTTLTLVTNGSTIINCLAGDTLALYASSSTATSGNTVAGNNHLSITRVGN